MRRVEEKKEEKGVEITIEEEVRVGDIILEKGDVIEVFARQEEEEEVKEEEDEKDDEEMDDEEEEEKDEE